MSNDHQRKDVKHPLQSLISPIRCVSNGVTCMYFIESLQGSGWLTIFFCI